MVRKWRKQQDDLPPRKEETGLIANIYLLKFPKKRIQNYSYIFKSDCIHTRVSMLLKELALASTSLKNLLCLHEQQSECDLILSEIQRHLRSCDASCFPVNKKTSHRLCSSAKARLPRIAQCFLRHARTPILVTRCIN